MKNYKDEYWKERRLAEDICRAMKDSENKLGLEELPGLEEFIRNNPDRCELLERMSDGEYLKSKMAEFRNVKEGGSEVLVARLRYLRKRRQRLHRVTYAVAGAAAVALFFLFMPLHEKTNDFDTIVPVATFNVPTLVLDDGLEVALTEKKGELPGLGSEVSVDGEALTYRPMDGVVAENKQNKLVVPFMYTYKVVLEDGTEVVLNANSELKYPSRFADEKREVWLSGEAYFTVSASERPFVVNTDGLTVQVYGTEFNVNTAHRGREEVLLVEGSVSACPAGSEMMKMFPGQLFALNKENGKTSLDIVVQENYLGWLNGNFACTLEPLSRLLDDVSAWYGVDFHYDNEDVKEQRITVQLSRKQDAGHLLEVLGAIAEVEFIEERKGVYIVK